MITRERKARETAEKSLAQEREQAATERAELLVMLDKERARSAAERAELLARLDAAQARAAEERRRFLAIIERLTQQINGGAPPASQ